MFQRAGSLWHQRGSLSTSPSGWSTASLIHSWSLMRSVVWEETPSSLPSLESEVNLVNWVNNKLTRYFIRHGSLQHSRCWKHPSHILFHTHMIFFWVAFCIYQNLMESEIMQGSKNILEHLYALWHRYIRHWTWWGQALLITVENTTW